MFSTNYFQIDNTYEQPPSIIIFSNIVNSFIKKNYTYPKRNTRILNFINYFYHH